MRKLKEQIIDAVVQRNDPKTLVVLKGFNRWLDDIAEALGESYIGTVPTHRLEAQLDLPTINRCLQSQQTIFITFENLLWLKNHSLAGIAAMYNYSIVCINNDLFTAYYPDINDESEVFEKNKLVQADKDNHIQEYYGLMELRNGNGYVIYNDATGVDMNTVLLTELVDATTEFIPEAVELPEEADDATIAECILDIIERSIGEVTYVGGTMVNSIVNKLAMVGVKCQVRDYSLNETTIDPDVVADYTEILHRKNATYDYYDLKIYADPYENNSLRNINQIRIIDDLVSNSLLAQGSESFRDIFVTAPTGSGKSVMFQVPAIYLAEKYGLLTLVISPLIGLMNDQVDNIQTMTDAAATINSDYTPLEKERTLERVKSGEVSILYLSPESLLSNTDISNLIGDRKIGLVVVDEAHIVATWGKSFRPDYWYLGEFISRLRNSKYSAHRFPIATFTATATFGGEDNMYQEIIDSLRMTPLKYIGNVKRDDISFKITHKKKEIAYREEKLETAVRAINALQESGDKSLVYVPYTAHVADLFEKLNHIEKIGKYYGSMTPADKNETLKAVKNGEKNVVIATKAFGMGIDVNDIKNIYHYAPTGNIADYVQEIGRAARMPGMQGFAYTDFYKEDFRYINQLHGLSSIKNYQVVAVLKRIFDLYSKYRSRNFLVAPEEFSFIFADQKNESDVDSKLKSTLLIIKKDFEQGPGGQSYIPLIFKPRGMFTSGYFTIKDDFIETLINRDLIQFFNKLESPRTVTSTDSRTGSIITTKLAGDTYKLDMKRLWEARFKDMSFGSFKRQFYENELPGFSFRIGEKILPKIIIKIDGGAVKIGDVRSQLLNFLDHLHIILDDKKLDGRHFTPVSLSPLLLQRTNISKKSVADMVAVTIIEILKRVNEGTSFNGYGFSSFNSATGKYVIRNNGYERAIVKLKQSARLMLSSPNDTKITRYFEKSSKSNEMIVAQLISLLEIADAEITTGSNPEFFIRVNSPSAIERIINNENYISRTVSLVGRLHRDSVGLMEYFFSKLYDDESRWNFIEKYFLGKLDIEKIKSRLPQQEPDK